MDDSRLRARRRRMKDLAVRPPMPNEFPVSVKIGVTSGCFHRQHSPRAYEIIDRYLAELGAEDTGFGYVEHESGPDVLAFLYIVDRAIQLAGKVVDLITVIVKARAEGIRRGDGPCEPLKIKMRRTLQDGRFEEEVVLEIDSRSAVTRKDIAAEIRRVAARLLKGADGSDGHLAGPQPEGAETGDGGGEE